MKGVIQYILLSIVLIGLVYIISAFIGSEFNPQEWRWISRFLFSAIVVIILLGLYDYCFETKSNER